MCELSYIGGRFFLSPKKIPHKFSSLPIPSPSGELIEGHENERDIPEPLEKVFIVVSWPTPLELWQYCLLILYIII